MAAPTDDREWYCVRTQPKHEQIAATHLRRALRLDVFNPKLRIRRATRRGAVWFVEALFPGYIFARFNWRSESQAIRGARGVSTLVMFGENAPTIPEPVIETLRSQFDEKECHSVPETIQTGDLVTIGGGPFHGLQATVLRVMPPNRRIQVLLDIMGGGQPVDIPVEHIAREGRDSIPPAKLTAFYRKTGGAGKD